MFSDIAGLFSGFCSSFFVSKCSRKTCLSTQLVTTVSFQLMSEQFRVLKGASHCILSAIAKLGGESPEYFDKMFGSMNEGGAHCMRTVMYPKRAPEDIPKKSMTHTNDGRGDLSSIIFRAPLLFLRDCLSRTNWKTGNYPIFWQSFSGPCMSGSLFCSVGVT